MDYVPFFVEGEDRPARWLVTCDHAANTVPEALVPGGDLGLPYEDMHRHIAYDVGAAGLASALGERLDATVIRSNFSRLVIDPNRGDADPTLVMQLYDGSVVPANRGIGADAVEARKALCHRPYHAEVSRLAARRDDTAYLAIHSFTPQLRGRPPRPWQVAVLYAADDRLARPVIDLLNAEGDLFVGDNEPYSGHLPGDSVDRHALAHGRLNVLVEVRNDLIATKDEQQAWADRLAPVLDAALARAQI